MSTNYDLASIGFALDTSYNYLLSGVKITNDVFLTIKNRNDLGLYGNSVIWPLKENQNLSAIGGLSSTPPISFLRSSSATRVNSKGLIEVVGNNIPRFDFDPITLQCRGLQVENTRSNIIPYYYNNVNTGWYNNTPVTQTFNNSEVLSPAGTISDVMKVTTGPGFGPFGSYTNKFTGISWASERDYTFSTYVKPGSSFTNTPYVMLAWGGPLSYSIGSNYVFKVIFDLTGVSAANITPSLNAWGSGQGGIIGTDILSAGNGWYRVSMCFKTPSATLVDVNNTAGAYGYRISVHNNRDTGGNSNVNDSMYFWGPQLEQTKTPYDDNLYPSSYIPTTTTAAVRLADQAFITQPTLSTFFNQKVGTLALEYSVEGTPPSFTRLIGGDSPRTYIGFDGGGNIGTYSGNNGLDTNISVITGTNTFNRSALSYTNIGTLSGRALTTNNSTVVFDTSAVMSGVNTTLFFGGNYNADSGYMNGHVRQIEYYNVTVPNNTLQTLTLTSIA